MKPFPGPLFFDLETIPDFSRQELFGLPEVVPYIAEDPVVPAESVLESPVKDIEKMLGNTSPTEEWLGKLGKTELNGKGRKGILDAVAKALTKLNAPAEQEAANNKKMATTPEMCRVVSMGWACGNSEIDSLTVGQIEVQTNLEEAREYEITECDILEKFWNLASQCRGSICGYNIANFDLPVIFARSIILGINPTRKFDMRPWGLDVCDLMAKRFPSAKSGSAKLKDLARYYQIPVPAGEIDGGSVLGLLQEGQLDLISDYVKSDVEITREIYTLFKGYFV